MTGDRAEYEDRGQQLAETTDATRAELLAAIEEADDILADAIADANMYVSHDEVRPSAVRVCNAVDEAQDVLAGVDPTRNMEDEE